MRKSTLVQIIKEHINTTYDGNKLKCLCGENLSTSSSYARSEHIANKIKKKLKILKFCWFCNGENEVPKGIFSGYCIECGKINYWRW